MVSRLNKVFEKGLEVWNQNSKVLGCGWIGKLKREDDKMSRDYRKIGTFSPLKESTKG